MKAQKRALEETTVELASDDNCICDDSSEVVQTPEEHDAILHTENSLEGMFSKDKTLQASQHKTCEDRGYAEVKPPEKQFFETCIKDPVIIEIFCGSSRVTACLKAIGLASSFGVDHMKTKAVSTCKIADLATESGQALLMSWLKAPNVRGVFLAPPCGTCSLARCIQLRDAKGRKIPGPVPLRSKNFPEGLPGLSKKNLLRVSLANELYKFLGDILRYADSRGMIIVVENPRSSLFLDDEVVENAWSETPIHGTPSMCLWIRKAEMDCPCTQ